MPLFTATLFPQPAPFIGREAELEKIGQLLDNPACRLLTLTGPGGIGKTRLAVEAARAQTDRFADCIFFVALQPLASPDLIVPAIAEAINFQFFPGAEPKQQLMDFLSGKSTLLMLDNFEHLLDGAPLVGELLAVAPGLKLLATSRERLNLLEEWLFDVGGLAFPTAEPNSTFGSYDAVRLFAEHAQRIQPGFAVTPEVAPEIARICRLVDGMPLAIELAAAWVRALTCLEIAAEIERSLDLLVSSARNVAPRHRNMRAVLDHSWSLLTDDERRVFQALSVFRGGFRREAAHEVAQATPLMLSTLVDKSLLRMNALGRYEIHELLRQYAEEKLREDVAAFMEVRERHSRYYAGFLYRRADDLKGRRQRAALDEVEADFENVRTAWNLAVEQQNGETIMRAMESLWLFCDMRSRFHEGMELFWHAHVDLARQTDVAARCYIRWVEMWRLSARFPDGYDSVNGQIKLYLAAARARSNHAEAAFCLWTLGAIAQNIGTGGFIGYFRDSMALYEEIGDRFYTAKVADFFAARYSFPDQFDIDRYLELTHYSIEHRRAIGDQFGLALAINNLLTAALVNGDYAAAERYLDETDGLYREVGSQFGLMRNHTARGVLAFWAGDFETARASFGMALESLPTSRQTGKWDALSILGMIACVEGNDLSGQEIGRSLPAKSGFISAENALALAACGLGDDADARRQVATLLNFHVPFVNITRSSVLPVSAVLLAREGQSVWALEVLAYIDSLPMRSTGWLRCWTPLAQTRAELEQALDSEAFAAAWERGTSSRLEDVTAALTAHFGGEQPTAPKSPDALSERELEILRRIAEGQSNRQIADTLILAVGTVKWYVSQICSKLGAANRVQAIARARELNLLT